jgi:hypothetical protein
VDVIEASFSYFLEEIVLVFGSEGVVSLQYDEEKDA